ncbi:MAG: hypothetical protein HC875_39445 [Anaerolineales bacterium]|nr:hypothetical protein [Anaerolineales bacterium]
MLPPDKPKLARSRRLRQRQQSLEHELARVNTALAVPHILLPCGCKIEQFGHNSIKTIYCHRHQSFIFSPRDDGSDVFYFVNEEQRP